MGRELRMVPPTWEHPKKGENFIPLLPGAWYAEHCNEFMALLGNGGLQYALDEYGNPPDVNDYMPSWPVEEATHFCMYEDTSEGTPISPPMPTAEGLADWLAANNASAFGSETATKEQWLRTIQRGYALSAVLSSGGELESEVAYQGREKE